MSSQEIEGSLKALERGYLNNKVIKVIKSCQTDEQIEVAGRYVDLILMRLRCIFEDKTIADVKYIQAYNYLKNYYEVLMTEKQYVIRKKGYRKTFGIDFKNMSVKYK